MSQNHQSLEEILFELAVQKTDAAERAAFLDRVCLGNAAMRSALEELLEANFNGAGFPPKRVAREPSPLAARSAIPPMASTETPAQMVGRYMLIEKLGEGGFGEVWMAEQREPVRRRVALKIMKLGLDSRQIVARFEAERQALAMMDHPNIARIFDAGTTGADGAGSQISDLKSEIPKGRPYFVMELVRGIRITDYCDQNQLPTRERLDLFIKVCMAIQHAHQKGIIHRDIKPSNILVTAGDPALSGVPKVIDFGIAKATQQEMTDQTAITQFRQFIGTPAYISPEQAETSPASAADIDTRADIYSLGVLLYELLVGQTPFDAKEMMQDGIPGLVRIIREREPLRPSTRLTQELEISDVHRRQSTHASAGPTLEETDAASHRRMRLKERICVVRGDLDWIVMNCLEKDRTRRYATATDLAADIQRHLSHEPVVARPPSAAYRLQKTWRRNKLVFLAGAVVALALVVATGVSAWQAAQARQSRNSAEAARSAEAAQRLAAQTALKQEASQRQRAEKNELVAKELLYAANMNLIRLAWDENNLGRIRQLLEETAESTHRGFEWYYWQRQTHLALKTFLGHTARVWSADFSPDGWRMVTASDDGTAKLWEVSTGQELRTLAGHENWVRSAAFSPDGSRIVTGSKDYIARLWDAATGLECGRLLGHRSAIRTVAFSQDGKRIVSASQDGTARIWDVQTGRQLLELRGHSNWVFSAAFSPDGRRIVTAGDDRTARIWDATNGREFQSLAGHEGVVRAAAFSPDGRQVVTASGDQTAKVWDAESGQLQRTLTGHGGYVFSAAFSPDGRQIITASGDQTARIWDAASGQELNRFKGHSSEIYTAVFSKDGRQVLTASDDKTAKVWDATWQQSALPLAYGGGVLAVAISPDCQRIAAGGKGGTIKIWSAATGELILTLPSHDTEVRSLAFSPDGQRIVTGHGDGNAMIWLAANGRLLHRFPMHIGGVNSAGFSADGIRVITAGSEGLVKVWAAGDGRELLSLPRVYGQAFCASLSPDGTQIVGGFDNWLKVWDTQSGVEIRTLFEGSDRTRSSTFSADGRWILAASEDKTAGVWDARNGENRFALTGHTLGVMAANFSPDSERIVTGSKDMSAKVWEAATGKELLTLEGHKGEVCAANFSPDGQRIITGSLDGTVRVWAAALPAQIAAWRQEALSDSNRLSASSARPMLMARMQSFQLALRPGVIPRWLLLAPMDAPAIDKAEALEVEQIPGEARIRPRAGDRVRDQEKQWTWEAVEQTSPLLDFNVFVGMTSLPNSVAYAVCYLVSESPQSGLIFKIVSDDECKVYLNGQLIHRSNPNRDYVMEEEMVDGVELRAGTNTVVFKVLNATDKWLGWLRVLDASGQAAPNLHVTLEPDRKD